MITIAQKHYDKLIQLVRILSKNVQTMHPSQEELNFALRGSININQQLTTIYIKITHDLDSILETNKHLAAENKELNQKIISLKSENANLTQINNMQRSDLAKYLNENNKMKEVTRNLKDSARQKLKEKELIISELTQKVKKYKKISHEQMKKVDQMGQKINEIEITQKSSAKQKQLDEEMMILEAELQKLQANDSHEEDIQSLEKNDYQ